VQVNFQEEGHIYRDIDGNKIPSVSEILQSSGASDFYFVKPEVMERAQKFGTAFHRVAHLMDQEKLKSYDPNMEPWIAKLKLWIEVAKPSWTIMEQSLGSVMGFAGTPDRFGCFSGHANVILDYKTGAYSPAHAIQTAAYQILIEESLKLKVKQRFTLYISDEKYNLIEHKDKNDKSIFLSMLQVYNWKKSKGLLK
jgi:CRISPR/Cas system-associated exonuclease Cas4 (RecB family)